METNLHTILEPLCHEANTSALIIVRKGNVVTVASQGEGASVSCSIDYDLASQSVADTIMDAVITVSSIDKPTKPTKDKKAHGKDC